MNADELRELAELAQDDDLAKHSRRQVADYLRACADALDAGPVAWRIKIPGESELGHWFGEVPLGEGYTNEALYPLAMPASSQRQCGCRACLTPAQRMTTFVVCSECGNKRCPKADDHRNQCTGSNAPSQAQPLCLPEPMTDKAIVLAGTPWHWNLATGQTLADLKGFARAIEAETLRRVKEVNE